jgi:broad specificity phosphatase PhoE
MIRSLITMRHSVTAHNRARIISGRLDVSLSDEGRALAHKVPRVSVDLAVSSPSRRALDTAAIVTGRGPQDIITSALCLERDYGLLEGLGQEQVAKFSGQVSYVEVGGIAHSLNPPGGETLGGVRNRAGQFASFVSELIGDSVLVVSHEVFLQQFQGVLLGVDLLGSLDRNIRPLQAHHFWRGRNGDWSLREDAGHPGDTEWVPW